MKNYKYIFGPVPSRRLGISLGISPIPKKYCNYSCIYCQLGRTGKLTNKREEFYGVSEIIDELKSYLQNNIQFDVISIVGEGEPTLYLNIGELIHEIRNLTDKPIAVITNGALLIDSEVRGELANADIVLPSLDAYDEKSFKLINRPHGTISFSKTIEGLQIFSEEFKGQMWIEVMLIKGINDSEKNLSSIRDILTTIAYD